MRVGARRPWSEVWPELRAAAVPLAAVAAVLLLVLVLAGIVDVESVKVPKPDFSALTLKDYPQLSDLKLAAQIVQSMMWWLCLSVLLWVAALVSIVACLWLLRDATADDGAAGRRIMRLLTLAIVAALAVLAYLVLVRRTPLMSFGVVVAVLGLPSPSLPRLATLNTALAAVVGTTLMLTVSLALLPAVHRGDPSRQMRLLTRLMYIAAAFLFLWISTATAMYRLAAMLLEERARTPMLELAPTVSLMGGLFLSLLLAAAYLSSVVWLQQRHEQQLLLGRADERAADAQAPRAFFAAHWKEIVGLLMPVLPGAVGSVVQALSHAP